MYRFPKPQSHEVRVRYPAKPLILDNVTAVHYRGLFVLSCIAETAEVYFRFLQDSPVEPDRVEKPVHVFVPKFNGLYHIRQFGWQTHVPYLFALAFQQVARNVFLMQTLHYGNHRGVFLVYLT